MSRPSHSWEVRSRPFDEEEQPPLGHVGWGDSDEEDPPISNPVGDDAANLLIQFLFSLHYAGKLSARSLCVICWYASKAGGVGDLETYGFRSDAPSGHFQRHLDSVTGVDMKAQLSWRYTVDVPRHDKYDEGRTEHGLLVTIPHEALNEEVLEDPSILQRVSEMRWPPAYFANRIVRAATGVVLPLALYLDGVPSTTRDGVLGIFMYNLVSLKRHLIAVVRKSSLCRCGCKGWCTLHPIWSWPLPNWAARWGTLEAGGC